MEFMQISSNVKWADLLWSKAMRNKSFLKAAKSLTADRYMVELKQLRNELQQPAKQAI